MNCPHCEKPLQIIEEVFGLWGVSKRVDGGLVLTWQSGQVHASLDQRPIFDGAYCHHCDGWVNAQGGTEED